MRTAALLVVAFVVALLALVPAVSANERPRAPAYLVIVHPNNPATTVSRTFLQDAFLKKITRWPHDDGIRPADLPPSAPARIRFTQEVLKRTVLAVKSYWQQRIFSGRDVPPPELDRDEAVVAHVLKHEGAIGYVSGTANLNGAKPLAVGK